MALPNYKEKVHLKTQKQCQGEKRCGWTKNGEHNAEKMK